MKKKILLCLIAQLICWGIMTMSDYMEETCQSDGAAERCRHNLRDVADLWTDTGISDRCFG